MRGHAIHGLSLGHVPRQGCILQSYAFPRHQSSSWQCLTCAHQFQIHETRTTRVPAVFQVPLSVMKRSRDHPFHMFPRNICNAPQIGFILRILSIFLLFLHGFLEVFNYFTPTWLMHHIKWSLTCPVLEFDISFLFLIYSSTCIKVRYFDEIYDEVWYPTSPTTSVSYLCSPFLI